MKQAAALKLRTWCTVMVLACLSLALTRSILVGDDEFNHTLYYMRPPYEMVSPLKRALFHVTGQPGRTVSEFDDTCSDGMCGLQQDTGARRCLPCSGRAPGVNGIGGSVETVFFGGASIATEELNKFFMRYPFEELTVIEYKQPNFVTDPQFKELEARNFNIATNPAVVDQTFRSIIQFRPHYSTWGIGFTWLQTLMKTSANEPLLWLEISLPVQSVSQRMGLMETVVTDGGGVADTLGLDNTPHVGSMCKAFKQEGWKYSIIPGVQEITTVGVADMEINLGYNVACGTCCDLDVYGGFKIPTGTKIDQCHARYLFNPVIGNNHHGGIELGSHFGYTIFHYKGHHLQLQFDAQMLFLFANTQWRSFDLVQQGSWSRFIEVYPSLEAAYEAQNSADPVWAMDQGVSGINIFTKPLRVSPRFIMNTNSAFVYTYKGLDVEGGYNMYYRQTEDVQLDCWNETVAIKDVNGAGKTNGARTVGRNFTGSAESLPTYRPVTKDDLNLRSAAHPAVLSAMLYLALSYTTATTNPCMLGLGGIYEFSSSNSAIQRWFAFGKLGISF